MADLAHSLPGVARFRINLFRQRGSVSYVTRLVSFDQGRLKIVSLPQETINFRASKEGAEGSARFVLAGL